MRAGESCTFDTRLRRKDGTTLQVENTVSALRLPGSTYYLGIVRDVTERIARDLVYKTLMEAMNDAACVVGPEGKFLDVNSRATEMLGYTWSELLAMGPADLGTGLEPDVTDRILADVRAGNKRTEETQLHTKSGHVLPVEIGLSRTTYMGQEAVLGIVRDVTSRKLVEQSLLELSRRNQALLTTIPDIVAEVDDNKVYTWANDAALEFFGDDVVGKEAADYFVGPQDTYASVEPLFAGDTESVYVQSWQRRNDGESRLLNWRCRALRDPDGQVVGALSSARDITDLRRAETMKDARLRLLELAPGASVQEFLQAALRELELLTSSQIGFCNFMMHDGELFTAAAWASLDDNVVCEIETQTNRRHRVISEAGIWANCAREHRPLVFNDYQAVPDCKGTPSGHAKLDRILTVPVFRSGEVVAVFALGNKPTDYTEQDVETVSSFADLTWDVAARKQAEAALQESDTRNRRLFDSSPDAVFLSDPGGHFLDCNQTAVDNYGYSRDEFLKMTYRDLAAPDVRSRAGEHVPEMLEHGGTVFEWRHQRKDGTVVPVEIRTAPFVSQGKQRIIATVRDLTRSKAAEEALRWSEERFKSLASMTTEGIMIHESGVIVDANQAFARLAGFDDPDDLLGKKGFEVLPVSDRSRKEIQEQVKSKSEEAFEIELVRPDGSLRWALTAGRDIAYRDRPARLVFMRDITESKLAQEEHDRLQQQLQQAAKMESIGRLAGGVAHDFNNMLAVILGHTELVLEKLSEKEPLRKDMEEIRNAADHSVSITQQLLALARRQVVAPKITVLNKAVENMLAMLRGLIGEHVRLEWQPGRDVGNVLMDPAQLDQILVNLCLNARDAITTSGVVKIVTSHVSLNADDCTEGEGCAPGDYLTLSVQDDGAGMTPEAFEHMFEPFFTTKEVGEGTGLGLATVYGIVQQNNGFIRVTSDQETGTDICICLPETAAAVLEEPPPSRRPSPVTGHETLLVVEDEPSVLRLAKRILENLKYEVLAASDPAEALCIAKEHPGEIALVISDIVMPDMTGWELSEQLRGVRPHLRTLYVSGYTHDTLPADDQLREGIDFLQKPFAPHDLAEAVREVLDREG